MNSKFFFDKNHHAHLVVASPRPLSEIRAHIARTYGVEAQGNPDLVVSEGESLGIAEARSFQVLAHLKPVGEKKIFIFSYRSITTEAQNALLKLMEDPPPRTVFFLVVPSLSSVIPTLRSRLSTVHVTREKTYTSKAEKFLTVSRRERLESVAPLIEEKDKERTDALLVELEQKLRDALPDTEAARALLEIEKCRAWLSGRSPSLKLILEHLSLTLPQSIKNEA